MALSNFVKQLLETDSVFGTRAKKLTGINDRNAQVKYLSDDSISDEGLQLDISAEPSLSYISVAIHQYGSALGVAFPVPDFMRPGKFFRLGISNIATARSTNNPEQRDVAVDRKAAEEIDGVILLIEDVFIRATPSAIPRLEIQCSRAVGSGPLLEDLSLGKFDDDALDEFGPVDLTFDVRIASLINDQQIAAFSSRGSTRFNLDNIGVADTQDRGGGIASRYAAHYHGDKLVNLVSNTRDENNNPLYGLQLNEAELASSAFNAVYNPDVPFDHLRSINTGTSVDIRVEYSDGTSIETIATYGYIGTFGAGSVYLDNSPVPYTSTTNRGERVTVGSVTFEYDLPASMETGNLRRWAPVTADDPARQLYETAVSLSDVIGIAGGSQFRVLVVTNPFATVQFIAITASRDDSNNVDLSYQRATLGTINTIRTINVRGSTSPRPVTGNEFITFDDLVNVLSANTEYNITVVKEGSLNTMTFSTDAPPRKIIRFITPSNVADIFTTSAGFPLVEVEIGDQALNQVIVPAELVLDRQGNVVFSREIPVPI